MTDRDQRRADLLALAAHLDFPADAENLRAELSASQRDQEALAEAEVRYQAAVKGRQHFRESYRIERDKLKTSKPGQKAAELYAEIAALREALAEARELLHRAWPSLWTGEAELSAEIQDRVEVFLRRTEPADE